MVLIKKLTALLLCIVVLTGIVTGCGKITAEETSTVAETTVAAVTSAVTDTIPSIESTAAETYETTEARKLYSFKTKVSSSFLEETFGKGMCESWFSLVDAVLAGEDTFSCPNGHTYMWVIAEFPKVCFPVLGEIVDTEENVDLTGIDGTARFRYKVSEEEAAKMINEFVDLTEDILNESMNPDYTDFENMLSLYMYFENTYTYDYETAELVKTEPAKANYTSAYRLLTQKTGICCEIAEAYSYLLLQAGIEASVVSNSDHEWSIVKLGENYYHVDPTFALGSGGSLAYFMMNDEQRCYTGSYKTSEFQYVSIYSPEFPLELPADDETFKDIWDGYISYFDPETDTIGYDIFRNGNVVDRGVFDYSGMDYSESDYNGSEAA